MSSFTKQSVETLASSIEALSVLTRTYTIEGALPDSVVDDLSLIRSQVARASDTVSALAAASEAGQHQELHRLNNALTGIISLATLCAEDVVDRPLLADQLHETERLARHSARAIRDLSDAR